jgi:hypothetical protein
LFLYLQLPPAHQCGLPSKSGAHYLLLAAKHIIPKHATNKSFPITQHPEEVQRRQWVNRFDRFGTWKLFTNIVLKRCLVVHFAMQSVVLLQQF